MWQQGRSNSRSGRDIRQTTISLRYVGGDMGGVVDRPKRGEGIQDPGYWLLQPISILPSLDDRSGGMPYLPAIIRNQEAYVTPATTSIQWGWPGLCMTQKVVGELGHHNHLAYSKAD